MVQVSTEAHISIVLAIQALAMMQAIIQWDVAPAPPTHRENQAVDALEQAVELSVAGVEADWHHTPTGRLHPLDVAGTHIRPVMQDPSWATRQRKLSAQHVLHGQAWSPTRGVRARQQQPGHAGMGTPVQEQGAGAPTLCGPCIHSLARAVCAGLCQYAYDGRGGLVLLVMSAVHERSYRLLLIAGAVHRPRRTAAAAGQQSHQEGRKGPHFDVGGKLL